MSWCRANGETVKCGLFSGAAMSRQRLDPYALSRTGSSLKTPLWGAVQSTSWGEEQQQEEDGKRGLLFWKVQCSHLQFHLEVLVEAEDRVPERGNIQKDRKDKVNEMINTHGVTFTLNRWIPDHITGYHFKLTRWSVICNGLHLERKHSTETEYSTSRCKTICVHAVPYGKIRWDGIKRNSR